MSIKSRLRRVEMKRGDNRTRYFVVTACENTPCEDIDEVIRAAGYEPEGGVTIRLKNYGEESLAPVLDNTFFSVR